MGEKYSREVCTALLREMGETLKARGEDRLPQRSDFSREEVIAVKSFLGPWPRALESAGLKQAAPGGEERRRERRIAAKRRKTRRKIEGKKEGETR